MWTVLLRLFIGELLAEYLLPLLLSAVFTVVLVFMVICWALGLMATPGGAYRLAGLASPEMRAQHPVLPAAGFDPALPADQPIPGFVGALPVYTPAPGAVSDVDRYRLATAVGFIGDEAILAVAISIAEDGSGNPSALSGANWNGTRDLGLWQINSAWWPEFGGQAALEVPINNARAAFAIRHRQGWCAWSTYLASCGLGHNGAFAAYLVRATRAANGGQ